jgi:hypothetical protein
MARCLERLDPAHYQGSDLHGLDRDWPETNCYNDVWIEVLSTLGHQPAAAFGFKLCQDFEGDQITIFKVRQSDLQRLYCIAVHELALYDTLLVHSLRQLQLGRLVLVEVDAFYLPDTKSYRTEHTKTTIGINAIDSAARTLEYFHGPGYFSLNNADFDGILGIRQPVGSVSLFPYAEFVRFLGPSRPDNLVAADAISILQDYRDQVPEASPIVAFRRGLERHCDGLAEGTIDFDAYAFNTVRQLGANFELMASHFDWLTKSGLIDLAAPSASARRISTLSKTLLFQLARLASRRKTRDFNVILDDLGQAYADTLGHVHERLGSRERVNGLSFEPFLESM